MRQPLRGILIQEAGKMNRNGRLYSVAVLERMLSDIALWRRLKGTLGQTTSGVTVDEDFVSHDVVNLRVTDRGLVGDIRILSTPSGKLLQELWEKEIPFSIALRCLAQVDNEGNVTRCVFISADAVKETA